MRAICVVSAVLAFTITVAANAEECDVKTADQIANNAIGRGLNLGLIFDNDYSVMKDLNQKNKIQEKKNRTKVGEYKYVDWTIKSGKHLPLASNNEFFKEIKEAGFDSVRIPVRWELNEKGEVSTHQLEEVKSVVDRTIEQGLVVIIDAHYYDWSGSNTAQKIERFKDLWIKIASSFVETDSEKLYFELLNEPQVSDKWLEKNLKNIYLETVELIRTTDYASVLTDEDKGKNKNILRPIIVGAFNPNDYKHIDKLPKRAEFSGDGAVLAAFHYYDPFKATSAYEWCGDNTQELFKINQCKPWLLDTKDKKNKDEDNECSGDGCWKVENAKRFKIAFDEFIALGYEITLGEFGYEKQSVAHFDTDLHNELEGILAKERIDWIVDIVGLTKQYCMSWTYWNLIGSFGFVNYPDAIKFDSSPVYRALIPERAVENTE